MPTPVAAAVYARISSDQEGTAAGVKRQLADCHELAKRDGWIVAEDYVDNDVSAFTGKRRPAYERMLSDLRDGVRDGVLVYHVDRLIRRPIELEQFLDVVARAGVTEVRFASGADVNIANGDGLLVLRMMAAVAANESASKSRRVKRKLDEVAAAGRPHGGSRRPFGFDDDRVTIRPDEAAVIRDVVARFLAGESLRSLATWLDDSGIVTVYGKPWRTTTLRDVLVSPRIAGLREHRGQVIGPAVWDPIISERDRARVLALFEQRRTTRTRSPRSYLLSGLLRCQRCGHPLYSARRETSRRYVCSAGPDHRGCGRLTVVAEPLEELITEAVLYRLDTSELADALTGRAATDEETATLAEALADDVRRLDELATLYAAKAIEAREWMAARRPIEARINDTKRRLARVNGNEALAGLVGNGAALRAQWADQNLTRQHAIVRAVLDHAVIAPAPHQRTFTPDRVTPFWRV